MTRHVLVSAIAIAVLVTTACGRATPTGPSGSESFLQGTWTGTVTIEREGEPPASGPIEWRFDTVAGTNRQAFVVTIRSEHAWLPITMMATSAMTPSNQPPARISTQGSYPSPRGCVGTLLSVGDADRHTINADFSGVDCVTLTHSTFTGRVSLTKTE